MIATDRTRRVTARARGAAGSWSAESYIKVVLPAPSGPANPRHEFKAQPQRSYPACGLRQRPEHACDARQTHGARGCHSARVFVLLAHAYVSAGYHDHAALLLLAHDAQGGFVGRQRQGQGLGQRGRKERQMCEGRESVREGRFRKSLRTREVSTVADRTRYNRACE